MATMNITIYTELSAVCLQFVWLAASLSGQDVGLWLADFP